MIKPSSSPSSNFEKPLVFALLISSSSFSLLLLVIVVVPAMRSDGGSKHHQGGVPRPAGRTNGFIPSSFRAISSYLRIVSSGASTVARSAASVASSIVDRDEDASQDQVNWAGFDKLENEGGISHRVLLLGYRSGFQVWDVEEADNVRDLVSRHGGPVSFMQMLPKPIASKRSEDKFADTRPLLVVCADGNLSVGNNMQEGVSIPHNATIANGHDSMNGGFVPTAVFFYSLRTQSYVYNIKFRSVVYCVRCSPRVVAISLATQIHCLNATTLEREYTILTNPIVTGCPTSGGISCGPLALGSRWIAYSGSPVAVSNSGRVSPQHMTPSASFSSFSSNGSLVAHYAKESSKQLAAGIVTLGDMGYKKLSRYCSELLADANNFHQLGSPGWKGNGTVNDHLTDADNVGVVIVKDFVSKAVIAQFRAHKSPISALSFDPSGTLLVTASVQGHNINVFKIMPGLAGSSSACDTTSSCVHLYRLQRGFTNAVIQDISFSDDCNWIMISSSRGTNHLFALNPLGELVNLPVVDDGKNNGLVATTRSAIHWLPNSNLQSHNEQSLCAAGVPVTLSAVSRIKNGNNSWRGAVSGAAAAATGRVISLSGAVASSFHNCKGKASYLDCSSSKAKYHLLVFSSSGCMIQYALRISTSLDLVTALSGLNTAYENGQECDARLLVDAIQKWNICQKQSRREREDNMDIYGDNGSSDGNKIYPEGAKKGNTVFPEVKGPAAKGKITPEEKHHLYIAEAELHMHEAWSPPWARTRICFQSMVMEGVNMDRGLAPGGELEIERIPAHTREATSKDLVPVFDYLQTTKYQKTRNHALDNKIKGRFLHQRSGVSENGRLLCRSSSGSLDSLTDSGAASADLKNGIDKTRCDGLQTPIETKHFVNTYDSSKTTTQLETVNNRESLRKEPQLKFVNNDIEGLKTENHFEDEDDEID